MKKKNFVITLIFLNFISCSFAANRVEEYYTCSNGTIKYPLPSAQEYCSMYKSNPKLYQPCLQTYEKIRTDVTNGNCKKYTKTIIKEYTNECGALCKDYTYGNGGSGTHCSGGNIDCMKKIHENQMKNRINDLKQRNQ